MLIYWPILIDIYRRIPSYTFYYICCTCSNHCVFAIFCFQIHGFQEDSLIRPKTYCWASRPVHQWFSAMGWVLFIDQGCPCKADGISFKEDGDSRQTQGRGLLLCQSPRMPPRSWSSTDIMISSHVYIPHSHYTILSQMQLNLKGEILKSARRLGSGRVIVEAYL